MSLDLGPRTTWDAAGWIKPGQVFICLEPQYLSGYRNNFIYSLKVGDPVLLHGFEITKAFRTQGAQLYCSYYLFVDDGLYHFFRAAPVKSSYVIFNQLDKEIVRGEFEKNFRLLD